jgi:hypothetical protein
MTVWVVRYGNYEPAEIDSIWFTEELAQIRAESLDADRRGGDWAVEAWEVEGERT